jgi:putative salt-induced outer membrane protein YdiY
VRNAILILTLWLVPAMALMADQITMENGDRVTGSIIKKDGATLTVNSAFFGTITLPWEQVESVSSEGPLNVVIAGSTVQGAIKVADGRMDVAGRVAAISEVVAIRNAAEQAAYERMLAPGWTQLWAGSASLGWAGTAGNARTQTLSTGFNLARVTRGDKTSLYFNTVNSSATVNGVNNETARAVRGGVAYSRNIAARAFLNVFNDYEYDRFQNLDLRFVLGGGAGVNLLKSERVRLDLLGGGAYNRETFATPLTRDSAEAYWGNDYNNKLNSITTIVQSFRMFNNLSETGDYRVNFDLGSTTKLGKWLNWNLNFSDRYLSNPAIGRKRNDVLYSTGIGVTFAQ